MLWSVSNPTKLFVPPCNMSLTVSFYWLAICCFDFYCSRQSSGIDQINRFPITTYKKVAVPFLVHCILRSCRILCGWEMKRNFRIFFFENQTVTQKSNCMYILRLQLATMIYLGINYRYLRVWNPMLWNFFCKINP